MIEVAAALKNGKHQCLHGAEGANATRQDVFGPVPNDFPSNLATSIEVAALQTHARYRPAATSQQLLIKLTKEHPLDYINLSRLGMHLESLPIFFCILYLLNTTSLDKSG
jgi:hypothetical protein